MSCGPRRGMTDSGAVRILCVLASLLLTDLLANAEKHKDCGLPKPRYVHFRSRNMRAVVHWLPPSSLGDGIFFTVQYKRYGPDKWGDVAACSYIITTWCDLTNETYDYEEQYYARVMTRQNGRNCSKWAYTDRFNPITDTKLDPPTVNLTAGNRFISIKLSPPEKWKRNAKDKSLFQIFSDVEFKVSIINMKTQSKWNLSDKNSSLNVTKLDPNSNYCITVKIYIPWLYKTTQPSKPLCLTTLEDDNGGLTMKIFFAGVLPIVFAVLLCGGVGYSLYHYIHIGKVKRPKNLLKLPNDSGHGIVFTPEINIFCSFNFMNGSSPPCNSHTDDTEQRGSTTGKKEEEEFPQFQQSGYCPQGQEIFCSSQGNSSYNKGLLVSKPAPPNGLLAENYGLILHGTDSWSVEAKKDQLLEEKLPVEQAYKSQTACMHGQASTPLQCLYQNPMPLGNVELTIYESPPVNCYHQRQPDLNVNKDCSGTVLDWDRSTGRLNIPSLPDLQSELDTQETQTCDLWDQHSGEGLLAKLEQTLQKDVEDNEEDLCLLQSKGKCDLHVKMN